jgi:MoaA/NifB/PqqE/SkfB family radical SAM enzyme
VLTNGITPEINDFKRVFDSGLRDISVSFDTLHPQIQSDIYDGQDVWPRLERNLDWLSKVATDRNLFVLLNTVVSGLNVHELPDLVEFAAGRGFHISFVPLELASAPDEANDFAAYAPDMALTEDHHRIVAASFETLIAMKREGYPIFNSTAFLSLCSHYLRGRKAEWPCRAGQLFLSINPAGEASFCHASQPFASVLDENFEDRFRSDAVKREAAGFRKNCPDCLRPCWVEPTLAIHHRPSMWEQVRLVMRKF